MIRQLYNIGDYQYVIDVYDAETDLKDNIYTKKFVMLRNFDIMNNITSDTDIYVIDINTFDKFIKSLHNEYNVEQITSEIVFPILASPITAYSELYKDFNNDLKDYSLYNFNDETQELEYGTDVYKLLDKNGDPALIKCNIVRIYHPSNQKTLNGIIHIDSYINNIHFHFLCQRYKSFSTNSNTEFRVNNQIYSEYIDVLFPNIFNLFKLTEKTNDKEIYNIYYKEDLNMIYSIRNENFIKKITVNVDNELKTVYRTNEYATDGAEDYCIGLTEQLVPLNLLTQPFRIIEEIDPLTEEFRNVKLYLKQYKSIENNYATYPFNITLFPYSSIDTNNHNYLLDLNSNFLTNTFIIPYRFEIQSSYGFVNSVFSIITKFRYPNKEQWIKDYNGDTQQALIAAYKYYYDVTEYDYKYFWVNLLRLKFPEEELPLLNYVNNHWDEQFETNDLFTGENNAGTFKFKRQMIDELTGDIVWENQEDVIDDEKLARIIQTNYNDIFSRLRDEELEEDYNTSMNFIGYHIEIASDNYFKNIIYDTMVNSSIDSLDDFSFEIDNIFAGWNEIPENVICRISFIDRIAGNIFISNIIVFDNDQLKYMVEKNVNTIFQLNRQNENMKEIVLNNTAKRTNIKYVREELNNMIDDKLDSAITNISANDSSYLGKNQVINSIRLLFTDMKNFYNTFLDEALDINITPINFIDSINVITTPEADSTMKVNDVSSSKILFKPMFYRVNDLQNIRLRSNVVQNVGINLNQYMTKVEAFKLKIHDIEYVESGRNDVYVIFNINTTMIVGGSGKYDVFNQDDEYISSGNWIIY